MKFRPPPILRSRRAALIAVLVISVATHFAFYGTPDTVVFDEVHFGKFVSAYYTGEYYFDIHPPLGKLIIAGVAKVFGFVPSADFETIGGAFSGNSHLYLRLLPTLAGALLAPVIFLLALELGLSVAAAFAAGALIGMDNALLVQSRLVLLDSFLLLFGFSSVLCYLRWRNGGSRWFLPAAGVLAGAAAGIKWTGLSFLAIVGVMELAHLWIDRKGTARKRLHTVALSLVAAPLIVYTASFVVHFALLPKSGPGDAFMSQSFQATLQGSRYAQEGEDWPPINLLSMVVELNAEMFRSNQRLTATHPYSSAWYTWPFMTRPIFYWVGDMSRIYLLGNPVVWYGSTAAVVLALWFLVRRFRREQVLAVLVGAYALNFLPFIGIGRVMFLYHYFTALVFAVLVLAWLVDRFPNPGRAALVLTALAALAFLYIAPLSYGLPLGPEQYENRVLMDSWR